jgi:hypothetical protein
MSQKQATQRRWIVHRTFEPDRLSVTTLVQAYAHIVPHHIRVLRLPEAEGSPDTKQIPRSDSPRPKITKAVRPQAQPEEVLVIGSITKQEAS